MTELNLMKWFQSLIRWAIGFVFLWAGVSKLLRPGDFALLIDNYGLVPSSWTLPIAVFLPVTEVLAAVGLIFRKRWALHGVAGLTLLFIVILLYGIRMGLNVDCGCFGVGDPEAELYSSLNGALYKDLVMLLGIFFLYWRSDMRPKE